MILHVKIASRIVSYRTVSVRLSVPDSWPTEVNPLLRRIPAVGPAGRRYRLIAAQPTPRQCYIVSIRRKLMLLITDLLVTTVCVVPVRLALLFF